MMRGTDTRSFQWEDDKVSEWFSEETKERVLWGVITKHKTNEGITKVKNTNTITDKQYIRINEGEGDAKKEQK